MGVSLGSGAGSVPTLGSGGRLGGAELECVIYDSEQSLTDDQKAQARSNMGVPPAPFSIIGSFSGLPDGASELVYGGSILAFTDALSGRYWWALTKGTTGFTIESTSTVIDSSTCLDFSGVPSLTDIRILSSGLVHPPVLTGLTSLRSLFLWQTNFSTWPDLTGLTALRTITYGDNNISTPPSFDAVPALTSLTLQFQGYTSYPDFSVVPLLQSLDLSYPYGSGDTYPTTGSYYPPTPPVLTGLTDLRTLTIKNTPLTIPPVLTGLTSLQSLDLSYSLISSPPVLTGLTSLRTLNLSYSLITVCPSFAGLTGLTAINFSHSPVSSVSDLNGLSSLVTLDFSYSSVTSAPVFVGKGLASLATVTFRACYSLTTPPNITGLTTVVNLWVSGTGGPGGHPCPIASAPVITGATGLKVIRLDNCSSLTGTMVDNFYISLSSVIPNTNTGGLCNSSGSTPAISSSSAAARSSLAGSPRGWSLSYNS